MDFVITSFRSGFTKTGLYMIVVEDEPFASLLEKAAIGCCIRFGCTELKTYRRKADRFALVGFAAYLINTRTFIRPRNDFRGMGLGGKNSMRSV